MKTTTRLFCPLLAILFCLTACSDQKKTPTTTPQPDEKPPETIILTADTFSAMHLGASDTGIYNDQAIIRQYNSEKFSESNADQQKLLAYGEKEVILTYVESFVNFTGNKVHKYQSTGGVASLIYYDESQKLSSITATRSYFSLPNNLKSEDDYLSWIKELLKSFGVSDLSGYEYSCKTGLTISGDNWAAGDTKDYFYQDYDPSCEKLTRYEFTYTKKINQYKISDNINISISLSTERMSISFDQGQFSNVSKIELDEAKMQKTLEQYVNNCVDTQKYELLSYTVKDQTLTYVDGKLCIVCSVELNLNPLAISEPGSIAVLETIGVFCE